MYGMCDVIVPQPLLDNSGNTFLSQLVRYLEAVSDFSESDLQVELVGKLPVVSQRESLDFFLTGDKEGYLDVLYRAAGSPSYRKAAITVREVRSKVLPTLEAITAAGSEAPDLVFIKRGAVITIAFISGAIKLDVTGEAVESGFGKEIIRVKVIETGKEFDGIVTGPSEVHVEL